ncbi:GntR family transcriptional regulator [Ferrimonas pelagia]|uniref:GntR family transcriptional regulator n=1 Tax=Ferrimonas pelagia TaxID=1177826 RepID=A0ABP9EA65_9GAMM
MSAFDSPSAIYLQIADRMQEQILTGAWQEGKRIPSIREMAAEVQVNPNTVMRAYAHLQEQGVIFNRRGVGYFVSPEGKARVCAMKQASFIENRLPRLFHEAQLLGISPEQLMKLYQAFRDEER